MTKTSIIWYPLLYFLIFIGGILLIFIILSSILPNEKNKISIKSLIKFAFFLPIIFLLLIKKESIILRVRIKTTKAILDSRRRSLFLILAMLIYFFGAIILISEEEAPIRRVE